MEGLTISGVHPPPVLAPSLCYPLPPLAPFPSASGPISALVSISPPDCSPIDGYDASTAQQGPSSWAYEEAHESPAGRRVDQE